MNIVRFNEPLAHLPGKYSATSPLILWEESTTDPFSSADLMDFTLWPNGAPRLPFPAFRVAGLYTYADGCQARFRAWVQGGGEPPAEVRLGLHFGGFRRPGEPWKGREVSYMGEHWLGEVTIRPLSDTFKVRAVHWEYLVCGVDGPKGDASWLRESNACWVFIGEWLFKLCADFQNPSLHLCKVLPRASEHHSIQWRQARQHYVLLHKSHPANKEGLKGTTAAVVNHNGMERVAHARRAHYRMLSSPRFTRKRGTRVWVRSAWVGPQEWRDHSGQIYRIVDNNNNNKK